MRRARMEMESLLAEARTVEADLAEARDSSRDLPPKEEILAELSALRATGQDLASRAAGLERPIPEAQAEASVLASKKVVLARLGSWLPPGGFETLIVAAPVVTDRKSREALASLALLAKRRLVVAADFHGWSWTAPAPAGQDGQPAWRNLMAAPALEGPLPGTLSFLGPLPPIQAPGQGAPPRECLLPDPSRHAFLGRMGFSSGLARLPLNHPTGPALRAFGDGGPICPASALASVRLAVEAARSAAASGEPGDIYILSPGRAQAALARSLLSDFGSPAGVMAGEPHDFELWPPAPMAILDTALAPPLAGSDLSSPETGRPAILRALSLASGALVVCADPASVEALSPDSVLRGLWARLQDSAWPGWLPPQPAPFWEALDKARDEALFVMPPFGPSWWPPLAGHFLSALRRKVRLTIISELPPEESRQFPGQVIRELRLNGANVILSEGFRDLMALIDGHHFSLGAPGGPAGHKRWPFLVSLELPRTAPLISGLLQSRTLQDKLGPGGPHNCPLCGWPFVLVNQGRPRDFDYRQSLRLGCLNTSCANHRRPRRLDERWPFPAPPVCPRDNLSAYVLSPPGRGQSWVCPRHGPECPSYRLVPGDCPNHRP
ncbi:MAG: hypothetical protein LBP92_14690 [Deltaproteobacteria bacterium]|nr:hypothetical protein [Deltaproteobacteria bacterium]